MIHQKQTIYGKLPLKSNVEWMDIPNYEGIYQINKEGLIRKFCKYRGHNYEPHHIIRKPDGKSIMLAKNKESRKYSIDYLLSITHGNSVESLPNEKWVNILGFPNYMISNKGRILSKSRTEIWKGGKKNYLKERIIKTCIINSGYERVILRGDNGKGYFLVHRLVALHFIENPQSLAMVNHKDENKLNNVAENLEWCTHAYNCNYGDNQKKRVESRKRNNNGNYGYKRKWSA